MYEQRIVGLASAEINFLSSALSMRILPRGVDILEFGESEVFGDASALLRTLVPWLSLEAVGIADSKLCSADDDRVLQARALYAAIFSPNSYTSVDIRAGGVGSIIADLNRPVDFGRQWNCVINNGTAEHIFDQGNFFRAIHDATSVGGVMIHYAPCVGWFNHGFYDLHPGLFFDIAGANGYEVGLIGVGSAEAFHRIPVQQMVDEALELHPSFAERCESFAVLRKQSNHSFCAPQQALYRD